MVTRIAPSEFHVAEVTRNPRDAGDEALNLFAQVLVRGQEFGQIVRLIGRASSGSSNRSRTGEGSRASNSRMLRRTCGAADPPQGHSQVGQTVGAFSVGRLAAPSRRHTGRIAPARP